MDLWTLRNPPTGTRRLIRRTRRVVISTIGFTFLIFSLTKALSASFATVSEGFPLPFAILASAEEERLVQRGEYLVTHVAKCTQCHADPSEAHSPAWLPGRTVAVAAQNAAVIIDDGLAAPAFDGLDGWDEDDVVELLRDGQTSDGYVPRAPMPRYRFEEQDALAVAKYLKSLP